MSVIHTSKPFAGMKDKLEATLYSKFPSMFDDGRVAGIHIGSNQDSAPMGGVGGYRLTMNLARSAIYAKFADKMFDETVLTEDEKRKTFDVRVSDAVARYTAGAVADLMDKGKSLEEAQKAVKDSMDIFGRYDFKEGKFVFEPVASKVNDSMLSGMTTPMWNVSQIQKVFTQPYLKGYADRLVSKMGCPNAWADAIQIFTAQYEGAARLANVGHAGLEFNTSIGAKRRTGTMLSNIVNIVIDYEAQNPNEMAIAGQGAWLVNQTLSKMDRFVQLMIEIMTNCLIYFGDREAGFDGLTQIANRDGTYTQYDSSRPTADYLWNHDGATGTTPVNTTAGADFLLMFNHLIADKMEELHFLPTKCVVNCGSAFYKIAKWGMLSKVYNQNNPLSIIDSAVASDNKIVATMVSNSGSGLHSTLEICCDPMLDPNSPFNKSGEDLMFITFPEFQSALEDSNVLSDLVMMPTLIDNMILPSAPGYREGVVRSSIKRVGSLLCPVAKTVHCITGMGVNSRYTPAP